MIWIIVFLYGLGALLAVQYDAAVHGELSIGSVVMAIFWPFAVAAVWISALIQTLVDALSRWEP